MITVDTWWQKSARRSATVACARASAARDFSLFLLPLCLRECARCSRLSFFSARRKNRGALILVPSDSTRERGQPQVDAYLPGQSQGSARHQRPGRS